jgi:hypothetical protein
MLLFTLALAASASAVPTLVEFKIKDEVVAANNATPTADDLLSSNGNGGGKGKSGDKSNGAGNSGNSNGKADLKSLTLWLSTDGKSWKAVSSEVVGLSSDKITARIDNKSGGSSSDFLNSFAVSTTDITGDSQTGYYVGLSTTSTSYTSSYLSARLVSWQYVNPNGDAITTTTSIPEPLMFPLFASGAIGLGLVLGGRKKRS